MAFASPNRQLVKPGFQIALLLGITALSWRYTKYLEKRKNNTPIGIVEERVAKENLAVHIYDHNFFDYSKHSHENWPNSERPDKEDENGFYQQYLKLITATQLFHKFRTRSLSKEEEEQCRSQTNIFCNYFRDSAAGWEWYDSGDRSVSLEYFLDQKKSKK